MLEPLVVSVECEDSSPALDDCDVGAGRPTPSVWLPVATLPCGKLDSLLDPSERLVGGELFEVLETVIVMVLIEGCSVCSGTRGTGGIRVVLLPGSTVAVAASGKIGAICVIVSNTNFVAVIGLG